MAKGIYKLTNDRTGEIYIGQAQNLESRLNRHLRDLAQGKHHNNGMQKDHNRGDTFSFEILEKLPNATKADLYNGEAQYISKFNSFREGYNQTPGGVMDQFKGKYKYGGGRLPPEKYQPTKKYLTKVLGDCPDCGGYLIKKTGKHGEFVGCDNFPNCRFSCSIIEFESLSNSHSFKPSITTSQSKTVNSEFEKFCTKKNNYLTKSDCDYLAEKYDIDISNANTVKKANPIIRNHLKDTNQWDDAMKNLYNYINQKSEEILTDIVQESSVDSDNKQYDYEEPILEDIEYSKKVISDDEKSGDNFEESIVLDEKNKETTINASNEMHTKSTNENINYCINCGFKIDADDEYCGNCGEKIDRIESIEEKTEVVEKRSVKQFLFYCKDGISNEFRLSKIKCASWTVGIIFCLLLSLLICISNPQEYFIGNFMVCIVGGFVFGVITFIFSSIIVQIYEEHVH